MFFFSGFSLRDEECLFDTLLNHTSHSVSGFSYGSIKALRYVKKQLELGKRVDRLQLFSPLFFQTKSDKFKRLQLLSYTKNRDEYLEQFIDGCFYPYEKKSVLHVDTKKEELLELLNYVWDIKELQAIADKGVIIEVYLGGKDCIIDAKSAREFFLEVATVTYIKDANHFLQIN